MTKQSELTYPKALVEWIEDNIIILPAHFIGEEVIPAESVLEKLDDVYQEAMQEKAEILFEIVKPQTDKTLREITVAELKDLALNFKDGL